MKTDLIQFDTEQILLHIPHSSDWIPKKYLQLFYLNDEQLKKELLLMTDRYTNELFSDPFIPGGNHFVFPYSRLICDVERFRKDEDEIMAARGMGVCYTSTSSLEQLKTVTPQHREEMLKLYDRHHEKLSEVSGNIVEKYGAALLIDCHAFSSERLPYELGDEGQRPGICIGTDDFHTPEWLADYLAESFSGRGYDVAFNRPFSGTLVPMEHFHKDPKLLSVMIELNRKLYMDEATGEKNAQFDQVKKDVIEVIRSLEKPLNFDRFRNRFKSIERFRKAYGKLSYEDVKALLRAERAPDFIKAAMMKSWREALAEARSFLYDAE